MGQNKGECFNPTTIGNTFNAFYCDCGLDGLCPEDEGYIYPDTDGTEGDGIWQPGDGWIDENQNGIPDYNTEYHDNYDHIINYMLYKNRA